MTLKNSKIIAAALSLGLVLTACGNNNEDNKAEDQNSTETTDNAAETTDDSNKEDEKTDDTADEAKDDDKSEDSDTANAEDYDFTVVSREDGSGTRGAFIELVGLEEEASDGSKEDKTTTDAVVQNSTNGVMTTVAQDPTAIGYISLGSLNDTVKAVKVEDFKTANDDVDKDALKAAVQKALDEVKKPGLVEATATVQDITEAKVGENKVAVKVETKDKDVLNGTNNVEITVNVVK